MLKKLIILFTLYPALVLSAPFLVTDPSTQAPPVSGCSVTVNSKTANTTVKADSPLVAKGCKYDIGALTTGAYEFKATFFYVDPILGRQESVPSLPLALTIPEVITAPVGLSLVPQ